MLLFGIKSISKILILYFEMMVIRKYKMKDCKAAIKIGNAGVREGMVFMWGKELMIGNPSGAFKKTNRFLVYSSVCTDS